MDLTSKKERKSKDGGEPRRKGRARKRLKSQSTARLNLGFTGVLVNKLLDEDLSKR